MRVTNDFANSLNLASVPKTYICEQKNANQKSPDQIEMEHQIPGSNGRSLSTFTYLCGLWAINDVFVASQESEKVEIS